MIINTINGFNEINNLSTQTVDMIFRDPKGSAQKINNVALQVIENLPNTKHAAEVDQFLKSLTSLNGLYQAQYSQTPLQNVIDKLQLALTNSKQPPAASKKAAQQPSLQKDKLESQFRTLLKSLDLKNPIPLQKINELTDLLNQLQNIKAISPDQKLQLVNALQSIHEKGGYKEQFFERRAWAMISSLSKPFETALAAAETQLRKTENEGQSLMLKHLQQSQLPLGKLAESIPSQLQAIEKHLIRTRLELILAEMPDDARFLNKNFVDNFFLLKNGLENFSTNIFCPIFMGEWEKINNLFETKAKGFTALLKNYPDIHPELCLPDALSIAESNYIKSLKLEDLVSLPPTQFKQKMAELDGAAKEKCPKFFNAFYKKYFFRQHTWLALNVGAIKKPYNQAEDIHRNQNEGTCLQNSLERHHLLLNNPFIEAAKISMGSSAVGRVVQASLAQTFKEAKNGRISPKQAQEIETRSSKKFGLKQTSKTNLAPTSDHISHVMKLIDQSFAVGKGSPSILGLYSPDSGHAINNQLNASLKIFRIIDDNLGICEWDSYEEFQTQFQSYLEAFYSDSIAFSLQRYELLSI
jgi:hypothetical protein